MVKYKNTSFATKTFYGVPFQPGEIKDVPGYINDISFVRIFEQPEKEPPKTAQPKQKDTNKPVSQSSKPAESQQKSAETTSEPSDIKSKQNKEEQDGKDSNK